MPSERTEKSLFKSESNGNFITGAQYIAEIMVMREAEKEQVKLSQHFWSSNPWKQKLQSQVTKCYQLLKTFSEKAIINAIQKNKWLYSLRSNKAKELIQIEQTKLDKSKAILDKAEGVKKGATTTNIQQTTKKNRLSKLK